MSHYDCKKCGEYGCTDNDCCSPAKLALKQEEMEMKAVQDAFYLLSSETTKAKALLEARKILEDAGRYHCSFDVLFK